MAKEYVTLSGDCPAELHLLVNAHIREGWEPLGGVAVSHSTFTQVNGEIDAVPSFHQAMVRGPMAPALDWD